MKHLPMPPIEVLKERYYWDSKFNSFRYKKSIGGTKVNSIVGKIKINGKPKLLSINRKST